MYTKALRSRSTDTASAALLETIPTGGFAGFGGNGIAIDEATDTVFATVGTAPPA